MVNFNERFESERQDWQTPDEIFIPLNEEFKFTLDAAASVSNTKTSKFFDQTVDGLLQDWGDHTVWLNPPYGDGAAKLSSWVEKAYRASVRGATVVMLIPARTNTNWFHDLCLSRGEIRFIRGRPRFGNADHGLPLPLCVVIFESGRTPSVKSFNLQKVSVINQLTFNLSD